VLTFQEDILHPFSVWLNQLEQMLKWYGGKSLRHLTEPLKSTYRWSQLCPETSGRLTGIKTQERYSRPSCEFCQYSTIGWNYKFQIQERNKYLLNVALYWVYVCYGSPLNANSQMPCRAHAVPLPCHAALIHTYHIVPLPFSDSAVSLVKFRVVAGNIRTSSPTV
jgi:hypothetical protein